MPEIAVESATSPERAREIQNRLRRPANATLDRGINLRAGRLPPVKGDDANLFFVPKSTPPSTRLLQRLEAERAGIVPNKWPDDPVILRGKCGASFLLVPKLAVSPPKVTMEIMDGFTIRSVLQATSQATGFSVREIISARRTANIVGPRQIGMYLARRLTIKSFPEIGRRFGGKDHTTVLHACRKMAWLDTHLKLPGNAPVIEWVKAGLALIQEHGTKGPMLTASVQS